MRIPFVVVLAACCPEPAVKPPVVTAKVVEPPPPAPVIVPPTPSGPPIAHMSDVVDHPFGLAVADPYRWMEGGDNTELTTWLRAQGDHAAKQLAAIPGRAKLHARIRELGNGVTSVWSVQIAGGRMIYSVLPAGEQLARLATRDAKTERVLIDPAKLGTADQHASLNAYSLSPDGKHVSYVISMGGGELGALHVMDVATGKDLPDVTARIWGEGAGSWLPDSKGFFYTQIAEPKPGVDGRDSLPAGSAAEGRRGSVDPMLGMVCKLHRLGEPADKDVTILGRQPDATLPLAPEEWPGLWIAPDSQWVIAQVGGAHSEQRLAVAKLSELDLKGTSKTPWRVIGGYADALESAWPHGDRLYIQTYTGAPNRKVISVPFAKPELAKARLEIPEDPEATLSSWAAARDAIYVVHNVGGHARLSRWAWTGKATPIALPVDGWIPDLATDMLRDGATLQIETWLAPGTYYAFDPKTKQLAPTGLASSSSADMSSVAVTEVEVPSSDGARVPLSILHAKELVLDGSHPTIVDGYGGYGVTETPGFSASRLAWLERGGVIAVAHVRGGGEKGRRWQDDGSRDKKMNGIRDLIACGEYLVAQKYTSPGKLAPEGGSMGGVLIGRAITERPDLFAAAHIAVGIVNPLRILEAANGANQKAELGDPTTEAGYRSILEMDPYQHVRPNTAYPAVLFTIGLNDRRVAPWMTGKMAARMLASTTSGKPILVRVEADAGHGIGSTRDQSFAERADVWSFLLEAFGDPAFTVL